MRGVAGDCDADGRWLYRASLFCTLGGAPERTPPELRACACGEIIAPRLFWP